MATNISSIFAGRFRHAHGRPHSGFPRHVAVLASAMLLLAHTTKAAPADFTFIGIGILEGELTSEVVAVNDDITLAGCSSSRREQDGIISYVRRNSARWTPAEGLKALPLLPYSDAVVRRTRTAWVGGVDVTPDGTKLLFT